MSGTKRIYLIFALFLSSSCATTAVPSWVIEGRSTDFPESDYIVGFGQGDTLESAGDRARAEIAKIFKFDVSQTIETSEKYLEAESAKGSVILKEIDVSAITAVTTEKTLEGVEIALKYFKDGTHYALAVLNRSKAAAAVREEIDRLKKELKTISKGLENCQPLECARGHIISIKRLVEIAKLNTDHRIITGKGVWKLGDEVFKHAEAARNILKNEVAVGIVLENDEDGFLSGALKELLVEKGFFIRNAPPYDILIKGSLKVEPVERPKSEYKWVRLELHLSAEKGGDTFCSTVVNEEVGHNGYEQAHNRALYLAKKSHLVYFIETLWDKLFGEGKDETKQE